MRGNIHKLPIFSNTIRNENKIGDYMKKSLSFILLCILFNYAYQSLDYSSTDSTKNFKKEDSSIVDQPKTPSSTLPIDTMINTLTEGIEQMLSDLQTDLVATILQQEQTEELYDAGFSYQEIVKLHTISKISNKSIDNILTIDNAVIIESDGYKRVNLYVLIDALGLSNEAIFDKLESYFDDLTNTNDKKDR